MWLFLQIGGPSPGCPHYKKSLIRAPNFYNSHVVVLTAGFVQRAVGRSSFGWRCEGRGMIDAGFSIFSGFAVGMG